MLTGKERIPDVGLDPKALDEALGLQRVKFALVLDAGERFGGRFVVGGLEDAAEQDRHIFEFHAGALFDRRDRLMAEKRVGAAEIEQELRGSRAHGGLPGGGGSYMIVIIPTSLAIRDLRDQPAVLAAGSRLECRPRAVRHGRARRRASRRSAPETFRDRRANSARDASSKCGAVSGHRRHEAIGGFLRAARMRSLSSLARRASSTSLRNRDRCAAGLPRQPFPMPRQQRDLARHHAQFRPARARRRGVAAGDFVVRVAANIGRRQSRQHIVDGAAKIEIDPGRLMPSKIENRGVLAVVERLFRRARDLAQAARGDAAVALEGDARRCLDAGFMNHSWSFTAYYYPGKY